MAAAPDVPADRMVKREPAKCLPDRKRTASFSVPELEDGYLCKVEGEKGAIDQLDALQSSVREREAAIAAATAQMQVASKDAR